MGIKRVSMGEHRSENWRVCRRQCPNVSSCVLQLPGGCVPPHRPAVVAKNPGEDGCDLCECFRPRCGVQRVTPFQGGDADGYRVMRTRENGRPGESGVLVRLLAGAAPPRLGVKCRPLDGRGTAGEDSVEVAEFVLVQRYPGSGPSPNSHSQPKVPQVPVVRVARKQRGHATGGTAAVRVRSVGGVRNDRIWAEEGMVRPI